MRSFSFSLPGAPVPKERPRVFRTGKGVRTITPERTLRYEAAVWLAAKVAGFRGEAWTGPVRVSVAFHLRTRHRCDIDNLVKSILDGLNGKAFADDSQVVELHATKLLDRTDPRAEVTIEEVEVGNPQESI